jgi:chromosome partitioning protein
MQTIAMSIQKGGVGKTSLAVSLAVELARETGGVLLIDLDPQASASNWIGPREMSAELADVLFGKVALGAVIVKTGVQGLSLLPSAGLGGELNLYAKTLASQQDRCIRKVTREAAGMGFRYCVLDMSPAFGALEWAALMAADEAITPILPDSFAADGLSTFAENLKKFREDKETAKPFYKRLLINGIDRRIPQHRDTLAKIKDGGGTLAVYEIPVDPVFRKGQAAGVPIQDLAGAKKETLAELNRLARDIITEDAKE